MRAWGILLLLAACGSKNSGNPDAPISQGGDGAVDAVPIDAMVSIDAPVFDFSCLSKAAPTTAIDPLDIAGGIAELTLAGATPQINPADGVTVQGCKPGTTNCGTTAAHFASATTPTTVGTAGSFAFDDVATGATPYAAYLRATKQGNRQTFSWPTEPFTVDVLNYGMIMFNSNAFALITIGIGVTQSAQNGDLGLLVVDCANRAVTDTANLSFVIMQNGQPVQGTTTFDLGSVNSSAKSSFFIFNVPGGSNGNHIATEIIATYSGVSPAVTFPTRTVGVVASSTSQTILRPGYL